MRYINLHMTAGNNGLVCGGNIYSIGWGPPIFCCRLFLSCGSASLYSNADPDPSFNLNADTDATFHLMRNRIRILPSSKWCKSAITDLQTLDGSILILYASILNALASSWLHFEPLNLLNFDFFVDPASQNNADLNPHPQPCSYSVLDPPDVI